MPPVYHMLVPDIFGTPFLCCVLTKFIRHIRYLSYLTGTIQTGLCTNRAHIACNHMLSKIGGFDAVKKSSSEQIHEGYFTVGATTANRIPGTLRRPYGVRCRTTHARKLRNMTYIYIYIYIPPVPPHGSQASCSRV